MAEAFNDITLSADKATRYAEVADEIAAVLDGEPNLTARMATVTSMLANSFDHYFWTGFYIVDPLKPRELVVGPYQGTLGCLRIAYGRGVCGAAAASGETQLVPDVHAFPGHIACDGRSQSEIVVPVHDADGQLIAVFDVDSDKPAAFDDTDQRWLETILKATFG
ncbi:MULTISPECIES: GAF domain-containing protein [Caulobacter]|jgi:L-methionine (R)-S-oxide reductase|uniref:GAF domain-containing protein n=1 Tax=Caulobacter vibrioides OR37 TaxID=1292034 RepID=R0EN52_CAUVI|nr:MULTISPECIES: GAF domain-containing protein [Caulobacter]ENZ82507.1 GAF domain-containing protein [Caulobacter vibrioides OR37]MBQ1559496.1 GAF domain-containing protein [Caulobacter sp.]